MDKEGGVWGKRKMMAVAKRQKMRRKAMCGDTTQEPMALHNEHHADTHNVDTRNELQWGKRANKQWIHTQMSKHTHK